METRIPRNLRVVSARAILSGLASTMGRAAWQPFVLSLGAPMTTLGMLEAVGGMRGLLPAPVQYVSGWLSDRLGRKPFIVLGCVSAVLAAALFIQAALHQDWRWLLPGVILAGAGMMADPPQDSLIAESTPQRLRGRAFSLLMVSWIAPGIVAPALGGWVADQWGYTQVYLIQLALYGLSLGVVAFFLRETLRAPVGRVRVAELGRALARIVVPPPQLRGFYITMAVDSFTWGLGWTILYGMLVKQFGFTTFQIGLLSSVSYISWTLAQMPIGWLIDRFGCKPLIVLAEIVGIPLLVGWMVSTSFASFVALQIVFGVIAAAWVPTQRALLANSVEDHQRGEAMGRLAAFQGLIGFPAPFIGGLLYDHLGYQAPLMANLVFDVICIVLMILTVKEPPRHTEEA